jgi:hypothetical protein
MLSTPNPRFALDLDAIRSAPSLSPCPRPSGFAVGKDAAFEDSAARRQADCCVGSKWAGRTPSAAEGSLQRR